MCLWHNYTAEKSIIHIYLDFIFSILCVTYAYFSHDCHRMHRRRLFFLQHLFFFLLSSLVICICLIVICLVDVSTFYFVSVLWRWTTTTVNVIYVTIFPQFFLRYQKITKIYSYNVWVVRISVDAILLHSLIYSIQHVSKIMLT